MIGMFQITRQYFVLLWSQIQWHVPSIWKVIRMYFLIRAQTFWAVLMDAVMGTKNFCWLIFPEFPVNLLWPWLVSLISFRQITAVMIKIVYESFCCVMPLYVFEPPTDNTTLHVAALRNRQPLPSFGKSDLQKAVKTAMIGKKISWM